MDNWKDANGRGQCLPCPRNETVPIGRAGLMKRPHAMRLSNFLDNEAAQGSHARARPGSGL